MKPGFEERRGVSEAKCEEDYSRNKESWQHLNEENYGNCNFKRRIVEPVFEMIYIRAEI